MCRFEFKTTPPKISSTISRISREIRFRRKKKLMVKRYTPKTVFVESNVACIFDRAVDGRSIKRIHENKKNALSRC